MAFYRNDSQEARDAWEKYRIAMNEMKRAAKAFAASVGGEAVITRSMTSHRLHGVKFSPRKSLDIWTAPDKDFQTQRPRSAPRKGCDAQQREAHKSIKADFDARFPCMTVSSAPLYEAIGTDWGAAMFGGVGLFERDGVTYIDASTKLNDQCIEILGSEYDAAAAKPKRAAEAGEG